MNLVILGCCTLSNGDISFDLFNSFGAVEKYDMLTEDEIISVLKDADAVILNRAVITDRVIENSKKLKYIGVFATGYNNIDIVSAKRHGVTVTNIPSYSTNSVAAHTIAFILQCSLKINEYNNHAHGGNWKYETGIDCFPFPAHDIEGKTLGILGMGNIGKRVAMLANAFDMNVIFYNRSKKNVPFANQVDFDTLLTKSDFISLHAPLNDGTFNIINANALSKMKKTAYIINTSRGALIDEFAFRNALDNGTIAGAAIDVTADEPLENKEPLIGAKNLIMTPHVAWATIETRRHLFELTKKNLECYLNGNPINVVEE